MVVAPYIPKEKPWCCETETPKCWVVTVVVERASNSRWRVANAAILGRRCLWSMHGETTFLWRGSGGCGYGRPLGLQRGSHRPTTVHPGHFPPSNSLEVLFHGIVALTLAAVASCFRLTGSRCRSCIPLEHWQP